MQEIVVFVQPDPMGENSTQPFNHGRAMTSCSRRVPVWILGLVKHGGH